MYPFKLIFFPFILSVSYFGTISNSKRERGLGGGLGGLGSSVLNRSIFIWLAVGKQKHYECLFVEGGWVKQLCGF